VQHCKNKLKSQSKVTRIKSVGFRGEKKKKVNPRAPNGAIRGTAYGKIAGRSFQLACYSQVWEKKGMGFCEKGARL